MAVERSLCMILCSLAVLVGCVNLGDTVFVVYGPAIHYGKTGELIYNITGARVVDSTIYILYQTIHSTEVLHHSEAMGLQALGFC